MRRAILLLCTTVLVTLLTACSDTRGTTDPNDDMNNPASTPNGAGTRSRNNSVPNSGSSTGTNNNGSGTDNGNEGTRPDTLR